MKNNVFFRILVFVIGVVMIISLFACESTETPTETTTEESTQESTEETSEETTELPADTPTEEPSESEDITETATQTETETQTDTSAEEPSESEDVIESADQTDTSTEKPSETESTVCEHEWGEEVAKEGKHTKECILCGEKNVSEDHFFEINERGVSHICKCGVTKSCLSVQMSDANGHWRRGCDVCEIEAEKKADHSYPSLAVDTDNGISTYRYICECGYIRHSFTLSPDVNYYTSAGQLSTTAWGSSTDGQVYMDDSIVYQRFEVTHHGGTIPLTMGGNVEDEHTVDINGGSGIYFVFKMKTENAVALSWRITAKGDGETAETPSDAYLGKRDVITNGEWITYVVDIQTLIDASGITTYGYAGDVSKTKFAAGFMYGNDGGGVAENTYIDIAYFAVCDTWEEVADVVGDEIVIYTDWMNSSGDQYRKSDGDLPVITEGENATKVIYEKTGDNLYVYLRSPYAEKYTMYHFGYKKNESAAFEGWSLISVAICDTDLNVLYYPMPANASEVEGALLERLDDGTAAPDFISGGHGDEQYKTVRITVDGVDIDMNKDYVLSVCESVCAYVESDVFRCNSIEKVFERTKTLTWSENGMEIKNCYVATAPITIERPALSMLAIYCSDSGVENIISQRWDNVTNEWVEIPYFDTIYGTGHQSGMTKAELNGKLSVSCEMTEYNINGVQTQPRGWFNYDGFSATNRRVKIYIEPFQRMAFVSGDAINCISVQKIFATE